MLSAIIDLGTNTCHLLIFDSKDIIFKTSSPTKIGLGEIEKQIITDEGIERGIHTFKQYRKITDDYGVKPENIHAFATSALRSAKNKEDVLTQIYNESQIKIQVIDGNREAELIYKGARQAVVIDRPSMIMDIGGGSIEFIICDEENMLWQRSFEIGGQRLIERFMKKDPISHAELEKMEFFLQETLLDLTNAIHQYHPKVLVGSGGTFDTLNDIYFHHTENRFPPKEIAGFDYPISEFPRVYEQLVFNDRSTRMKIPGMKELRVDMIVVAADLIRFLIKKDY